jgi:hypothetical protein
MPRFPVKIKKRRQQRKFAKRPLDKVSEKARRGRPPKVRVNDITGRAYNNGYIFGQIWDRLWPLLSKAKTEQEVENAFEEGAGSYHNRLQGWSSSLMLDILHDPKFPKKRKAQINFFAESLAGLGAASPRYCRDICAKERAKEKRRHHIIRFEFYIHCSCGFKGHSRDHACPKCGTEIPVPWQSVLPI